MPSRPNCSMSVSAVSGCFVASGSGCGDSRRQVAPVGGDGHDSQRASDRRLHLPVERHAALRLAGGVRLAKPASRLRIVGLPDLLAEANLRPSRSSRNGKPTRPCPRRLRSRWSGGFGRFHTRGRLVRRPGCGRPRRRRRRRGGAGRPIRRGFARRERRGPRPSKTPRLAEPSPETSERWSGPSSQPWQKPREKVVSISAMSSGAKLGSSPPSSFRRQRGGPQAASMRRAIVASHAGDVFGRLQSPFDLQGGNARGDQLRQPVVGGQIVRTQRVSSCRAAVVQMVGRRRSSHRASGTAGRIGRDWRCGRPSTNWPGIGRNS